MSVRTFAIVKNERGIHARPSSEIAKESLKYKSNITLSHGGKVANAKEVLQVIILELLKGTKVEIVAEGEDEEEALKAIKSLIEKEYLFD